MKFYALLVLLFLLGGCAAEQSDDSASVQIYSELSIPYIQHPPYAKVWHIIIDIWVDESSKQEILKGLEAWQEAAPCPMMFDIMYESVTEELPPAGTITIRLTTFPDPNIAGYTYWEDDAGARVLLLSKAELWNDYQRVVRHELGHAFRLRHQYNMPSIMLDPPAPDNKIYPVDIQNYAAFWCPK